MPSERPWVESLVACIPDALAFVEADGTVLWANPEFSRLTGISGAAKGLAIGTIIDRWQTIASSAARSTTRQHIIVAIVSPDGTRMEASLHLAQAHASVGAEWVLHLRPAGEVEELRRRLDEQERSHSFLKANTSDLIVRTNESLEINWTNETALALFRCDLRLEDLLSQESMERLLPVVNGSCARLEVELESAPGARPAFFLRGIIRRLVDDGGQFAGISMILRDDSENRRLALLSARFAFTPREEEIVEYLVKGYSNLNIASILGISESGVKFHVRNVFSRTQVNSRTELMALLLTD